MEKRKSKSKNQSNPHIFISPFPLEECVDRLPAGVGNYVSRDTYTFSIPYEMNSKGSQLRVALQRTADGKTLIHGAAGLVLGEYLFLVGAAFFVPITIAGLTLNVILGLFLVIMACTFVFYFWYQDEALLISVLALFKPVQKVKHPPRSFLIFPRLGFNLVSGLPLDDCALRLQRLTFNPSLVRVVAVNAEEYHFSITRFGPLWNTISSSGILRYESDDVTRVRCHLRLSLPSLLFLLFPIGTLMDAALHGFGWAYTTIGYLSVIYTAVLVLIFPLYEVFSIHRTLNKILNP